MCQILLQNLVLQWLRNTSQQFPFIGRKGATVIEQSLTVFFIYLNVAFLFFIFYNIKALGCFWCEANKPLSTCLVRHKTTSNLGWRAVIYTNKQRYQLNSLFPPTAFDIQMRFFIYKNGA